jgi:hypothetical protein
LSAYLSGSKGLPGCLRWLAVLSGWPLPHAVTGGLIRLS